MNPFNGAVDVQNEDERERDEREEEMRNKKKKDELNTRGSRLEESRRERSNRFIESVVSTLILVTLVQSKELSRTTLRIIEYNVPR